jgi:hypothetical protein
VSAALGVGIGIGIGIVDRLAAPLYAGRIV